MPNKPGVLSMRWTKRRGEGVNFGRVGDLMFAWGKGVASPDGHLLNNVITTQRCRVDLNGEVVYERSFAQELVARGYDITTLRFSIKKAAIPPNPEAP